MDDADKLGDLLTTLDKVAAKVSEGEGTAGKLLNDPQLYNDLVESARQLARTLEELQATVKAWREDGLRLKLR